MKILGLMAAMLWGVFSLNAQVLPAEPPAANTAVVIPAPLAAALPAPETPLLPLATTAPAGQIEATLINLPTAKEWEDARTQLKEKDALIEKLSKHLDSALARLNRVQSPINEAGGSLAALKAAQAKLQKQNDILKAKQQELLAQNEELTRKKQVLDLENRQLFQALNGRPVAETSNSPKVAKADKEAAQKWVMER